MRIHILRRGREGGPCVCGIACGGEIKRIRSVFVLLRLSPSFHLADSLFPFIVIVLVAASPFPSRSRPSSDKHATSFSLLLASTRSLSFSIFLSSSTTTSNRHRFSLVGPLPSLFARREGTPGRRRRRDSIIIADSLISINCRAREFPMDSTRSKR